MLEIERGEAGEGMRKLKRKEDFGERKRKL